MMQCVIEGHSITALANLKPPDTDELDSYMFQTVGHHAIYLYAEAMELPLYRRTISGGSIEQGKDYHLTPEDEVEDLYQLLKLIKEELSVEAVSVGAILSDYQRVRVEHVCKRLELTPLSYLWRRDQADLMQEMIQCGVDAMLIKVAALGLEPEKHLGKTLAEIYPHMMKMQTKYGLNVCGEGGEYETFTLDCPLFRKKIIIDDMETVIHSDDAFAQVAYLHFNKMHLEDKNLTSAMSQIDMVRGLTMKCSNQLMNELFPEGEINSQSVLKTTGTCTACHANNIKGDYVRVWRGNNYLTISGIMGVKKGDETTEVITCKAMEHLKEMLLKHNSTTSSIVAVHLYLQSMKNFSLINSVYKQYFDLNPPIRLCVQTSLPENVIVQMDCIAHMDCSDKASALDVQTMHVQGLSHWASANIGPYSQAKKIGHLVFMAGQIGLCPADLRIIEGGVVPQTRLSLRHVSRVLAAMTACSGLHDVVSAVCYVTHKDDIATVDVEQRILYHQSLEDYKRKTMSVDGTFAPFHVQYVVVPALPHGALVEWQISAVANWDSYWEVSRTICCVTNTNSLMTQKSQSGEHTMISFTTSTDFGLNEHCTMDDIINTLNKVLPRDSDTTIDLCVIHIFYRSDLFDSDLLNQAYDDQVVELTKTRAQPPTAAFIPVVGFSNDNHAVCVYGCIYSSTSDVKS